ncbi:zf-MIZ-domain-containing protein, partial [Clavulina sp. PMI_390]
RFKPSPFFVLETSLTEISSPSDVRTTQERGTISVSYTLSPTQHSSLRSGGSTSNASHQIRLYCTSNSHWTPNGSMGALSIPIEFPPVVEVRVNGTAIQGANTRGLKKKAGTAPPVDLSKLSRVGQNKVDFTFMNNSSPFVYKKFYFMINYVKYTPVTDLVARLRSGRTRSYDDVKRQLWAAPSVDDDIIAGAQKITLKCPLSYMRISTPARASTCTHGQCFDALSWYSMMEQTTTYLCPVCDRSLNYEDLIMDGFFDQILVNTPEDTEEIMVEPDGEWHTLDHKHHSSGYKPPKPKVAPSGSRTTSMTPVKRESSVAPGRAPVVVLDSDDDDDDDDGYHTAPSQAYNNSQTSTGTARRASGVIDLTLDSDDDEPAPP